MSPIRALRALFGFRDGEVDWDRLAIAAIAVGLIVRAVFVFALHPPHSYLYSDMQGYVSRAMQVVLGNGQLPRALALYPPGTHLLLAAPLQLFGTGHVGLHWADAIWFGLAALVPVFAWRLVRLLLDPATAALAAGLCSVYPLFVLYSGFFTSETPSVALLCGALWLGYRAGRSRPWVGFALGVGSGLLGGALVATRPQFILNTGLILVALVRDFAARWRAGLGFVLALTAVLVAVVAVNSSNTGHLTGVSENGGITFFQAHCNVHEVFAGQLLPGQGYFFGNPVAGSLNRGHNAVFPTNAAWDQGFFYNQGWKCIRSEGVGHVLVLGRELADLTVTSIPWPLDNEIALSRIGDVANILYCAALLGVIMLVARMRRRRTLDQRARSGTSTMLAQLAMVGPVTLVFGSEPRYRVPYDVFGLALLAWLLATGLRHRSGSSRFSPHVPMRREARSSSSD